MVNWLWDPVLSLSGLQCSWLHRDTSSVWFWYRFSVLQQQHQPSKVFYFCVVQLFIVDDSSSVKKVDILHSDIDYSDTGNRTNGPNRPFGKGDPSDKTGKESEILYSFVFSR